MTSLLQKFLAPLENTEKYPIFGVLGIPGPIFNNTAAVFANLSWPLVSGETIAKELNLKSMHLLNDFVLNGYGVLSNLKEGEDYVRFNNEVNADPNGPIAMIGAGTGLGHGLIFKNTGSKYYEVYPSEGGHQDFAAQNELQFKYATFLKKHYNTNRISLEQVGAGPSIPLLYKFFTEEEKVNSSLADGERENSELIIKSGLAKTCEACVKVVEFFVAVYGAAVGNLCLITLPTGGVYLLGGLSIALEEHILKENIFRESLYNKGVCESIVKRIPIYIVRNGFLGVKGAEEYAKRILNSL
jgi:glucokinase